MLEGEELFISDDDEDADEDADDEPSDSQIQNGAHQGIDRSKSMGPTLATDSIIREACALNPNIASQKRETYEPRVLGANIPLWRTKGTALEKVRSQMNAPI